MTTQEQCMKSDFVAPLNLENRPETHPKHLSLKTQKQSSRDIL